MSTLRIATVFLQAEASRRLAEVEAALARLPPPPLPPSLFAPGPSAGLSTGAATGSPMRGPLASAHPSHQHGSPAGLGHAPPPRADLVHRAMAAVLDDVCAAVAAQLAPYNSAAGAGPSALLPGLGMSSSALAGGWVGVLLPVLQATGSIYHGPGL